MLKSALKQRGELQLAITIDVSIPFFKQRVSFLIFHYYFTRNLGNLAALKAKSREIGYGGDGDMVVGAVIAPEVIVHLTAADMHIDYDAALLVVQSLKARQYGDLVSRTKLFIKDAQKLYIASHS